MLSTAILCFCLPAQEFLAEFVVIVQIDIFHIVAALVLSPKSWIHSFELYHKVILNILSQVFHLYRAAHIPGVFSLKLICTTIVFSRFIRAFSYFKNNLYYFSIFQLCNTEFIMEHL